MKAQILERYGTLLDILSQIVDVERQLVRQGAQPGTFVPDQLLVMWQVTFRGGYRMMESDLDEEIVSVLLDFDYFVAQLIDVLPTNTINKEWYIRHDELWQEVRDMADWTLTRLAFLQMPGELDHDLN